MANKVLKKKPVKKKLTKTNSEVQDETVHDEVAVEEDGAPATENSAEPPKPAKKKVAAKKGPKPSNTHNTGGIAGAQLLQFVHQIENLEKEKTEVAEDIKDVYAHAKSTGFDVPTIRTMIKLRKMDPEKRKEKEAILDTYMFAIGAADE